MPEQATAVIGAGAWGTALAIALARHGKTVHLWGKNQDNQTKMAKDRQHPTALPGITFPDLLLIKNTLAETLHNADLILIAVPSHAFRECLQQIDLSQAKGVVAATKGLDPTTSQLLSTVAKEYLPAHIPYALLSGPSFASEVAKGLPTAITVASKDKTFLSKVRDRFFAKNFRVYTTSDVIGVEIGGAVKNVLAVAAGINDGLGFGMNARAALITRGLHEMMCLGLAAGCQRETLMGLAGVGDLILTCNDNQSRNRCFGLLLGQGVAQAAALATIQQTVEAIHTAKLVRELAQRLQVEMPICEGVFQIIHCDVPADKVVAQLLDREPKQEF